MKKRNKTVNINIFRILRKQPIFKSPSSSSETSNVKFISRNYLLNLGRKEAAISSETISQSMNGH